LAITGSFLVPLDWNNIISFKPSSAPNIDATKCLHPSSKHIWNMWCSLADMRRLKRPRRIPSLRLLKSVFSARSHAKRHRHSTLRTQPTDCAVVKPVHLSHLLRWEPICGLNASASMLAPATQAPRSSRNRTIFGRTKQGEVFIRTSVRTFLAWPRQFAALVTVSDAAHFDEFYTSSQPQGHGKVP
jgi:hypothetical protein